MLRFLFGFVLGLIVGVVVATLLAPAPGRETRERLGQAWRERGSEETRAHAQEAMQRARATWETVRQRVQEAVRAGREAQAEAEAELRAQHEELIKEAAGQES
jgi:gas vesicle protein